LQFPNGNACSKQLGLTDSSSLAVMVRRAARRAPPRLRTPF